MRIFRTLLFTTAAIGVAYALSPEVRRRVSPVIDNTARFGRRVSKDYIKGARKIVQSGGEIASDVQNAGSAELKSMVQSMQRRINELERNIKPDVKKTNEYMAQYFLH